MENHDKQPAKSILLIDDDEINKMVQKRMFERWGYQVISACDGAVALQILENKIFDLVVSDINLPFVNGFKLSEYLFINQPRTPLLFVSGLKLREIKAKLKGREMLQKPVHPKGLKFKIDQMMNAAFRMTA